MGETDPMSATQHISTIDVGFLRATLLKVAFHPDLLRRCQAVILYAALTDAPFTADECLPKDMTGDDTKISGIAFGSLASMKLIAWVDRRKAGSASRNGAFTNVWAIAEGKRSTVLTWLDRNGFPRPDARQTELAM